MSGTRLSKRELIRLRGELMEQMKTMLGSGTPFSREAFRELNGQLCGIEDELEKRFPAYWEIRN